MSRWQERYFHAGLETIVAAATEAEEVDEVVRDVVVVVGLLVAIEAVVDIVDVVALLVDTIAFMLRAERVVVVVVTDGCELEPSIGWEPLDMLLPLALLALELPSTPAALVHVLPVHLLYRDRSPAPPQNSFAFPAHFMLQFPT